jgi:putative transposase
VNRFNRWRKAGVWDYLLKAVSKAYEGDVHMIDSSSIRVHQHAANGSQNTEVMKRLRDVGEMPNGNIGGFPDRTAMWHIAMPAAEPSTTSRSDMRAALG